MTRPLIMPLWFVAHNGLVHFEGRPLTELVAMRARTTLRKAALDAPVGSQAETIFAAAKDQAEQALADARNQSRNHAA